MAMRADPVFLGGVFRNDQDINIPQPSMRRLGVLLGAVCRYLHAMNHDPDANLIQRVVQAMREAARMNGADSPHTDLEAMARAAIGMVLMRHDVGQRGG